MATQDNTQETDRNDPAIDPDTPDNGMNGDKASEQTQGDDRKGEQNPSDQDLGGAQKQTQSGAQGQQNQGNTTGENSFTPGFTPEEHESPDTTKEVKDTGKKDGDVDAASG